MTIRGRRGPRKYRRKAELNPLLEPFARPLTEGEELFERLRTECENPKRREREENSWIRPGTWAIINRRAELRKAGQLTRKRDTFLLNRKVRNTLKADRIERARWVGEKAVLHLADGDVVEAWQGLRGWYRTASERAPKPCHDTMETQTVEREELYGYLESPGEHIPRNVERPPLDDPAPSDEEIRAAAAKMKNRRSGGATQMRAEDLKTWLRGAEAEERAERDGEDGFEGQGDAWRTLVRLVRHVWDTGEIPQQTTKVIIVLIPKSSAGDYRGIGLLEVVWKLLERVLVRQLEEIELHDCLHGSRAKRGCGTGIMEAKLAQQLAFVERTPLYVIFVDLRKAYDAMDRGRCLKILRDAGVGEKALCLIARFWRDAELVCRAGGRYGRPFKALRGVT